MFNLMDQQDSVPNGLLLSNKCVFCGERLRVPGLMNVIDKEGNTTCAVCAYRLRLSCKYRHCSRTTMLTGAEMRLTLHPEGKHQVELPRSCVSCMEQTRYECIVWFLCFLPFLLSFFFSFFLSSFLSLFLSFFLSILSFFLPRMCFCCFRETRYECIVCSEDALLNVDSLLFCFSCFQRQYIWDPPSPRHGRENSSHNVPESPSCDPSN